MRTICTIIIFCVLSISSAMGGVINIQPAPGALQKAIDSITPGEAATIHLHPGTYLGPIVLPKADANVTFQGDDAATTIISFDKNVREPMPAGPASAYKGTGVTILANDFHTRNITFENTSGDHGQAMALRIDGDRATLEHCRLLGWQDTLLINNGRMYFHNCYIAGRVDFIYGSATAVFDHCEIHSRNGGHITAASTPADHPFGFVFMDCDLTGDAQPWTLPAATQPARVTPIADLGRPWRPYAAITFLRCKMGPHIRPAGWDNWRNPANEKTARYAEFGSTGPGANPDRRVAWAKQLTADSAEKITVQSVLGGVDHWDPSRP